MCCTFMILCCHLVTESNLQASLCSLNTAAICKTYTVFFCFIETVKNLFDSENTAWLTMIFELQMHVVFCQQI